ncbi:hypothetical protein AV903_26345 (plasmid) [Erwinia tracheiphila]|uniref:Uncharacterized protein n=1 Tax=Erwinia tracheiphila TaxID=65700 RepID=A0A345CZW5_9GAMM|nr:hypothetical protein AV903_26345 [Erwinia tracheiphila]
MYCSSAARRLTATAEFSYNTLYKATLFRATGPGRRGFIGVEDFRIFVCIVCSCPAGGELILAFKNQRGD